MKTPRFLVVLFSTALALGAFAQTAPAPAAAPAPVRAAPVISPEINGDGSVTFRLKAANAKQVTVRGQWAKDPLTLTRADDGFGNLAFHCQILVRATEIRISPVSPMPVWDANFGQR